MKAQKNGKTVEPDDKKVDLDTSARLKKLEKRALNGREAWRCCVRSKRQAQKFLLDFANAIQEAFDNRPKEALVVPLPPSVVTGVGARMLGLQAARLGVGAITVFGSINYAMDLATQAEVSAIKNFVGIATDVINKTESDCLRCVESKVFGQSAPRRRRTFIGGGTILRREPGGSKP